MVEKIKQALERAYIERAGLQEERLPNELDLDVSTDNSLNNPLRHTTDVSDYVHEKKLELLNACQEFTINTKTLSQKRIITFDNIDSNIESYRLLRTQLIRKMKTEKLTTLGITSANAGEGKSLTAVNLALSLAKSAEFDVVLIDGDISRPSIHKLLGIEYEWGLIDLINETVDLQSVLLKLNIPNFWVIPGRNEKLSLLDQASSNRIDKLIKNIADVQKRLVIVDLPPVLAKDDTLAIAAHLDAIILIVEEGSTKSADLSRSVELIAPCNLIGTVLNKFSGKQDTYY